MTDRSRHAVRADIVAAEPSDRPIRRMLRRSARGYRRIARLDIAYRTVVGILGGGLSLLGLLLVPLPGPGWLVVFLGLAILGTEFHWAGQRLAGWLKRHARPVLGVVEATSRAQGCGEGRPDEAA